MGEIPNPSPKRAAEDELISFRVFPAGGQAFERTVEAPSVVIGRSSTCGMAIADSSLSREHARFFQEGGHWWVEDLGSRNGTFLRGEKISGPQALNPGDVITLGGTTLTVETLSTRDAKVRLTSTMLGSRPVLRNATLLLKAAAPDAGDIERAAQPLLKRYVERLQLLNEVHQALAGSIALQDLLEMILDRVYLHLKPEEGSILLRSGDGSIGQVAARSLLQASEVRFSSQTLIEEVVEKGHAALVQDALLDERFDGAESIRLAGVRSLVAAPLLDAGRPLGMIVLWSRASVRQFQEEDMELLTSLASVAALRIRNVALAGEAETRRRLEHEMVLARQIQEAALQESLPDLPGYEIHAASLPSRIVSGDLYQVLTRADGRECVLLVADVSGKGIPAALLTTSLEALCAAPIEEGWAPDQIFTRVSALLHRRTSTEKYATAFIAILNIETGKLRYANAGHNRPLLLRVSGGCDLLESTGAPLGLIADVPCRMDEAALAPGDTLVIYTDGISEAENPAGEAYGEARLVGWCRQRTDKQPTALARALGEDLETFAQGVAFADDRTVVILRRNAAGPPKETAK